MGRASALAVAILLAFAGAASAKGGPIEAEVCGADGCNPIPAPADLQRLADSLFGSVTSPGNRLDPVSGGPAYELRIRTVVPGGAHLEARPGRPVEVDFLPNQGAVRVRSRDAKGHWARLRGPALAILRRAVAPLEPLRSATASVDDAGAGGWIADLPQGAFLAILGAIVVAFSIVGARRGPRSAAAASSTDER